MPMQQAYRYTGKRWRPFAGVSHSMRAPGQRAGYDPRQELRLKLLLNKLQHQQKLEELKVKEDYASKERVSEREEDWKDLLAKTALQEKMQVGAEEREKASRLNIADELAKREDEREKMRLARDLKAIEESKVLTAEEKERAKLHRMTGRATPVEKEEKVPQEKWKPGWIAVGDDTEEQVLINENATDPENVVRPYKGQKRKMAQAARAELTKTGREQTARRHAINRAEETFRIPNPGMDIGPLLGRPQLLVANATATELQAAKQALAEQFFNDYMAYDRAQDAAIAAPPAVPVAPPAPAPAPAPGAGPETAQTDPLEELRRLARAGDVKAQDALKQRGYTW